MKTRTAFPHAALAALTLSLAACGGGEGEANNAAGDPVAEGEALLPSEAEIEQLPNEAAADEAADMNLYGGNAAAGETGNANRP